MTSERRMRSSGRSRSLFTRKQPLSAVFGAAGVHHRLVMRDVICGHPHYREAFLEPLAHAPAIEFRQPLHGLNCLLFVIDQNR